MARKSNSRRAKPKKVTRRGKKKISALTIAKIEYVDYKDTDLLRKFVSERSKIKARRISGNDAGQQRHVARAVKNAREMALIPYTNRVTTQRRERRTDDRAPRADGPPPRPTAPPPGSSADGTEVEALEQGAVDVLEQGAVEVLDEGASPEMPESIATGGDQ
ncbi:MAG: 30S ribosomal protein S18 [Acidimicrobiia bacterium]|nr:30S ribosomal protein S18 [Actinomycetota bacterium]MBL6924146.1 30S ribosomal protein S18 [Acidimicrobiia bacterium]MBL6926904.1 30S ribosomal protein S18 [Acidimicrobiia bacterium]